MVERVRGVERLNKSLTASKTVRLPEGSAPDVPVNGTLLAEVVLSSDGAVVSWMHWTAGSNLRRGVLLKVAAAGTLTASVYVGPNGADTSITTAAVPNLLAGTTKVLLGVRWTGTSFAVFYVDGTGA
ncbi:MAG TPA: hypothetical protein ENK57_15435 [Polyangiaceae bacterium]|nr:hypothetical protein [Polyangiaceae bacterium]